MDHKNAIIVNQYCLKHLQNNVLTQHLLQINNVIKKKYDTDNGARTHDPRIRSPVLYPTEL